MVVKKIKNDNKSYNTINNSHTNNNNNNNSNTLEFTITYVRYIYTYKKKENTCAVDPQQMADLTASYYSVQGHPPPLHESQTRQT